MVNPRARPTPDIILPSARAEGRYLDR